MDPEILNHCYVYEDGVVTTLSNYLFDEKIRPEMCGVKKLEHFSNCYNLFCDLSDRNGNPPRHMSGIMLQGHPYTGLVESTIPGGMIPLAIVYFDFNNYIKSQQRKLYKS